MLLKGDCAFKLNDPGDSMYFLKKGAVQITNGGVIYCTPIPGTLTLTLTLTLTATLTATLTLTPTPTPALALALTLTLTRHAHARQPFWRALDVDRPVAHPNPNPDPSPR